MASTMDDIGTSNGVLIYRMLVVITLKSLLKQFYKLSELLDPVIYLIWMDAHMLHQQSVVGIQFC